MMLLLLLTTLYSFSQNNFRVSGKVTDESGKAVMGATIKVKGTETATPTDSDGLFAIVAPSGSSTLVITSVGFAEQEVAR